MKLTDEDIELIPVSYGNAQVVRKNLVITKKLSNHDAKQLKQQMLDWQEFWDNCRDTFEEIRYLERPLHLMHGDEALQYMKELKKKAEKYDKLKEKYDYAQEDIQISLNLAEKNKAIIDKIIEFNDKGGTDKEWAFDQIVKLIKKNA